MRTLMRCLLLSAALVWLAFPASTVKAHGHGGGMVAVTGPAASIAAPATGFYGGYAATAYYAPTTSGYSYSTGATYYTQPTGAYVPGMSPIPTNYGGYGYIPAGYRTASPGWARLPRFRRVR
jgi:hypothetical protein